MVLLKGGAAFRIRKVRGEGALCELQDEQWLQGLRSGEEIWLERFMERFMGYVCAVVRGRLSPAGSRQDLEECVSDVFWAFYRQAAAGEIDLRKGTVKGYLAVLARRRAVDCYRRLAGKPPADSLDREDLPEADSPPAEDFSRQSLDRQVLLEALGELGEPDREILIRRYYLGQSAREIGRAVGMRPNTVDKRVERSLEKLRRQMRAEE